MEEARHITNADGRTLYMKSDDGKMMDFKIVRNDSLKLVMGSIRALLKEQNSEALFLVKPQFEVGKDKVGKGGVVRDFSLQFEAIEGVVNESQKYGWYPYGLIPSPLKGPAGNQEYLLWMGDEVDGDIEIEKLLNILYL